MEAERHAAKATAAGTGQPTGNPSPQEFGAVLANQLLDVVFAFREPMRAARRGEWQAGRPLSR